MKYLLVAINAKYIHSNLAVYSLKTYAQSQGFAVDLKEYTINQPKDLILKDIYQQKADAVFFSCYIWNMSLVDTLIQNLHKVSPDLPIFLGGPEVSYDAPQVLEKYPFLAGILSGEGEKTFVEVLKSDWGNLPMGKIYESIPVSMDELPFVYDKMNMEELQHRIPYYESSRGCPFSCSYCLSSIDKRLRFRSFKLVKKELQFFIDNEVPQVKFVDRTFNCKKDHAMEIWKYIVEHDRGITNFHFEIAADLITEEQLELMASMRPGLIQLEIGVQSTHEPTLEAIRRKMDFGKLTQIVKRIQSGRNIHQHLDLIAGLPYEDYVTFRKSFNDVYSLAPDQLQLGFLKVLKGSYMHEAVTKYDCIYRGEPPYEVLSTKWMTYDEIILLKSVDKMVDIYYNSGQYTKTLPLLVDAFATPFDFYLALGLFYEKMGYEIISHSRIRRYDILLEFADACNRGDFENICAKGNRTVSYMIGNAVDETIEKKDSRKNSIPMKEIDREQLIEAMTIDLYLREKLKKAPVWAVDLTQKYTFDYNQRDPLTGNAQMIKLSE